MNFAGKADMNAKGKGGKTVDKEIHKNESPQGDVHTEAETKEDGQQHEEGKAKTLDELLNSDKTLQSEFDKKVTQALAKAKAKWEQQAKDDANEAKKLEKMTTDEKEKYQLEKDKAEFAEEKEKFAHEQLKTAIASELVSRGYIADFAEFLTGSDAETSNANIKAFETVFKKAVESATAEKLRGDYIPPAQREHGGKERPPKDFHEYEAWRKKNA